MAAIPIQTSTFPFIGVMSFPEGLSCQIKNSVFGVLRIPPLQLFWSRVSHRAPRKRNTDCCLYLPLTSYLPTRI